ncbi:hypothetical protein CLAFUW4_08894 [Fulvia fulva]|uniref:Pentatricopeptide repeat protein n=1 Tax=Passalora fulva TaxID=5499 RepID=A0A9Q8PG25_PASFU|nr:uncharacterized protein CLAFUR5_09001 [Fulvia fulva]KAK4613533.1 hypothetical protein CLAFUR4_08900 [Fulvia fulva]KAK4614885.1 hypothetical protein CLAFUR0_08892 [Fulvia fulva]UJO21769.1 hypothetical protein CLAFUR5_09001 [Fulvia fulva]WPV20302.1 hypothetical protein CLAFUW4_08894 [Fulvia fulva]WPV35216.1 hypothetical protein CLAFUW7_08895 [Fulvia fulva]
MLSLRLQRARVELQSHRLWLKTFVNGSYHNTWSFDVPPTRPFSTSRRYGEQNSKHAQVRQIVGKNPRTAWQKRERQKADSKQTINLPALSTRVDLMTAILIGDIRTAIALYHSLSGKKPLKPDDFRAIAQLVHQCVRVENQKPFKARKREDKEELVTFSVRLVEDLRHGNLLPNNQAHVHLLAIFKESGTGDAGVRFWRWLQEQDEEYVSTNTYAAAIDLLAVNGTSLDELEELYQTALARFPGNFHAYHLSPEAILPDREQPVVLGQLPLSLLRSIAQARLLQGKANKAYLALDSAFRLFPTSVPPRFLAAFNDERPVSESYTVFAMACRAGIQLPTSHYKGLLAKLRTSSDMTSLSGHMATLRTMLAVTYFHLGANGKVPDNSANEVIIAATQLLRLPGVSTLESKQRRRVVDAVLEAVRKMLEVFAQYGALPAVSVFNSIITNVAGYGRARETIGIALADMDALSLEPNEITRRSIMAAAGLLGDKDLVLKTWKEILDARGKENISPDGLDFHVLIKAARFTEQDDFAKGEYARLQEQVHFKHHKGIEAAFDKPLDEAPGGFITAEEVQDSVQSVLADVAFIEEKTKDRPVVQDFSSQDLPMTLLQPEELRIPDRDMREIYDNMTTEQGSAPTSTPLDAGPPADEAAVATSDTGISFGELRYENWKTMNYLLWLAEKHDRDYDEAVDKAIARGVRPPKRDMSITREEVEGMKSFGLSASRASHSKAKSKDVEEARKEIARLRTFT